MGLNLHRVEESDPRALDNLIKNLRRRHPTIKITTVYGLGYTIDDPDTVKRIKAALECHQ